MPMTVITRTSEPAGTAQQGTDRTRKVQELVNPHDASPHIATDQRITEAINQLRRSGHRRTQLRLAVVQALAGSDGHLTAESLQRSVEQHGARAHFSALYRALAELNKCGVACTAPAPGGHMFGLARPIHHHAVCSTCATVIALPSDRITAAVTSIEAVSGFAVQQDGLHISGKCSRCKPR